VYAAASCQESIARFEVNVGSVFKPIDLTIIQKGRMFAHYYLGTYMHGGGPSPSGSSFLHS